MTYVDTVDLAGTGAGQGAAMVGFIQGGTGAVARTVDTRLRETIFAKDFGVVADGTTDDAPALQAAINFAAGREIVLPAGTIRCASGLTDHRGGSTSGGDVPGLRMRGAGRLLTILEFDFNGYHGLSVDGSVGDAYRFQRGGGLSGLSLRAGAGRTIEAGLKVKGWWSAMHQDVEIGGKSGRGFTKGVYVPLSTSTPLPNPDSYQSTRHLWQTCTFMFNYIGVHAANGQGAAIWTFENCAITHNANDGVRQHGSNWTFANSALALNGLGGAGFGVNIDADGSTGSCTNLWVKGCEIDGNRSAGLFISNVQNGFIEGNRFISRRLVDNTGAEVDCSLVHVWVNDNATISSRFSADGNYHRIDTLSLLDAQEAVEGSVYFYYLPGTGSVRTRGIEIINVKPVIDGARTGTLTAGSTTVSNFSDFTGIQPGQPIKAPASGLIPYGTTIVSADEVAQTVTLSAAATGNAIGASLAVSARHTVASVGLTDPRYRNQVKMATGRPLSSPRDGLMLTGTTTQGFTNSAAPWIFTIEETGFTEPGIADSAYESASGGIRVPHRGVTEIRVRFAVAALLAGDTLTIRAKKNGSLVAGEQIVIAPASNMGQAPYDLRFAVTHDAGDLLQVEILDTNASGSAGHALSGSARLTATAL